MHGFDYDSLQGSDVSFVTKTFQRIPHNNIFELTWKSALTTLLLRLGFHTVRGT